MGTISGGAAGDAKPSGTLSSPSPPSESPWRDAPGAPNAECQQEGAGERVGAGAGGQGPSRLAASHLRGQRPHGGGSRPAPPGWEHLPHRHDLSGLISPPRAGCRPWTSTSHRGDNSEKSVLRCGVGGRGPGLPTDEVILALGRVGGGATPVLGQHPLMACAPSRHFSTGGSWVCLSARGRTRPGSGRGTFLCHRRRSLRAGTDSSRPSPSLESERLGRKLQKRRTAGGENSKTCTFCSA